MPLLHAVRVVEDFRVRTSDEPDRLLLLHALLQNILLVLELNDEVEFELEMSLEEAADCRPDDRVVGAVVVGHQVVRCDRRRCQQLVPF